MHDVIEDGEVNGVDYKYLQEVLYPFKESEDYDDLMYILDGVLSLTHYPEDSYESYVRMIPPRYRKFKIKDIAINLADSPSKHQKEKYKKAMNILVDRVD